jgi:hypothetical protein
MAGVSKVAAKCVADVQASIEGVPPFKGAGTKGRDKPALLVYSDEDLLRKSTGIALPIAGVVYEGMRGGSAPGGGSHNTGLSAELVVSLILLFSTDAVGANDGRQLAIEALDAVRDAMKDRRSPTGHFWRFVVEAAAEPKAGVILWVQRWATPVQLMGR